MIARLYTPQAQHSDIAALQQVERLAWSSDGENIAAAADKILARLHAFSEGVTLATVSDQPAGSQYAFRFHWDGDPNTLTSWDAMTSEGWYDRVHCSNGNTGFLVGVGVVPQFRGTRLRHNLPHPGEYKLSELLIARTLDRLFAAGVTAVVGNARVPAYHLRPDLSIAAYCALRRCDSTLFDPVLRFHERMGAAVLKPVEYSMEDAESRNAGCWVIYRHRFAG